MKILINIMALAIGLSHISNSAAAQNYRLKPINGISCHSDNVKPQIKSVKSWASDLVRRPSPKLWHDALSDFSRSRKFTKVQCRNILRLQIASNSLIDAADYRYSISMFDKISPTEVIWLVEDGLQKGILTRNESFVDSIYRDAKKSLEAEPINRLQQDALKLSNGTLSDIVGDAYLVRGSHEKAIEMYQNALKIGKVDRSDVQFKLAIATYKSGKAKEAAKIFKAIKGSKADKDLAYLGNALVKSDI